MCCAEDPEHSSGEDDARDHARGRARTGQETAGRRQGRVAEGANGKDTRDTAPPKRRQEARKLLRAFGYPILETARHSVAYAFLLALRTGMRAGELAGLTWGDVHSGFVRLPTTKNGSARDVPLSAKASRVLEKMRGHHDESVFGVSAGSIDVHFRAARARAGLSGMNWHDTRHTAATWIAPKLQLLELCKMFGWRDPKQAMIYFNPSASDIAGKL